MTGQTGQHKTVDMVTGSRFNGTDGTQLLATTRLLFCLHVRKMRMDKTELSCLSVSYCYLYSLIFRKSQLINVILPFCVVWLGLPETASAAISRLAVLSVMLWPITRLSITVHAAPIAMQTPSSKQLPVPSVPSCFRVTWLWSVLDDR